MSRSLVALLTVLASLPAAASHLSEEQVVAMENACQALREEKLAPEKAAVLQNCMNAGEKSEAECQAEAAAYGEIQTGAIRRLGKYYDLPECQEAYRAPQAFPRQSGPLNVAELLLHQYEVSPFAAKVRRALRYKNIPFEVRNYRVVDAGLIRKTISPTGKTPVLEDDSGLVIDSTAILRHLEERYPEPAILPESPADRARVHIIEDWADESFFFYDLAMRGWPNNIDWLKRDVLNHDSGFMRWLLYKLLDGFVKKTGQAQGIGRKDRDTICAEVAAHFDALVDMIGEGQWLVGDHLTVADIAVASMCTVIERAEEAAAMMQERPTILAWRERVDAATFAPGTPPEARATT